MPIYTNIAGAQKEVNDWYSNIDGVSKKFNSFLGNIDGTSVELLVPSKPFWRLSSSGDGTLASNTRTRMVSDSATVSSDGTFTLINATSISGRPAQGKFFVSISTSSNSSATTGSTLYYATNSSGAYRSFNIRSGIILSSSSFPSEVKNNRSDVFYELNGSQHNLYISKDLIPSLYRWTQYNANVSYTYKDVYTWSSGSRNYYSEWDDMYYLNEGEFRYTSDGSKFDCHIWDLRWNWPYMEGKWVADEEERYVSKLYRVTTINNEPYPNNHYYPFTYDRIVERVVDTTNYSKGTSTGRYAYSARSSAYPTSGYYSGYWYDNRTTIT